MHRKSQIVLSLGVAFALILTVASFASASPITYNFTVTATDGPLSGTTEDGTFSYDSNSIVPGGQNATPGLLTSLTFFWNGTVYDETTANTGFLDFDVSGNLVGAVFGNDCAAGCITVDATNTWIVNVSPPGGVFFYAAPGIEGSFTGIVSAALAIPVPEPSMLALFSLGCAIIGSAQRFRRKAQ